MNMIRWIIDFLRASGAFGLYFGSGGGGGGDGGAAQREAERQARIKSATEAINSIFNEQKTYVVGPDSKRYTMAPLGFSGGGGAFGGLGELGFANPDNKNMLFDESGNAVSVPGFRRSGIFGGSIELPDGYYFKNVNARDDMYAEQKASVYDLNKKEVDRQAVEAERSNRFGLARNGLLGGSVDVDSNQELDRRTNEGLLRAGGIADQSAADLRVADERTRSNLIGMAQSGIDTGTAAQMALGGLKANSDSVAQARSGATVGSLFNDLSQAYLVNQVNAGRANGQQYGGQWYGVSNPRQTSQGTVQG